ncbi:MAG: cupin-like domain-containing protein [Novosphingobium sp.]|nr:cupin-like domain-containing protein [Novosphingobium sp.]
MSIFPPQSRAEFASNYPEIPYKMVHNLDGHPLLELDALANLAECLPAGSVECNSGEQPIGVDDVPEQTLDQLGDTVRNIAESGSWVGLRHVEQHPDYALLLEELLSELRPEIEARTGEMLRLESFIFVTSPGGVTPFHFDPEHNILLQICGSKVMTLFPAGDSKFAADELHETFQIGNRPELPWRAEMEPGGTEISLSPGEALFVPVMAPHFVRTGPKPSISLSLTWRSEWSFAEADARIFNSMLRRIGVNPRSPARWPARNLAKAYGYRAIRRISSR